MNNSEILEGGNIIPFKDVPLYGRFKSSAESQHWYRKVSNRSGLPDNIPLHEDKPSNRWKFKATENVFHPKHH